MNVVCISASRPGPIRAVLFSLGTVLIFLVTYVYWQPPNIALPSEGNIDDKSLVERQIQFWKALHPLLELHSPACATPRRQGSSGAIGFNAIDGSARPDVISMPVEDMRKMQQAHTTFLEDIRNSSALKSVHNPNTRGLVSTAGGSYLPVFVISLRMLRRTGSTLPVEVFLKGPDEYERSICEGVLPSMDARCIVLSDILGVVDSEVEIAHYQLKIFAILFSSFEDVIWLDADCFPLYKPELLFNSDPFKSRGMITWPDYWASTASPLYYNISSQSVPPMTLRASSETGEIMISKKNHQLTMLLSAYYNYYGPSHYFMLLSQGAPGEGDKETFIQAASAVDEPFYTTSERVAPIGHPKPEGGLSGSAMVQSDPIEDYLLTSHDMWRVRNESVAKAPRAFFIHAHYPKFNPATVFGYSWETTPTVKPDGGDGRAWIVPEGTIKRFGYDVEDYYWKEIEWVSCHLEDKFRSWEGREGICLRVQSYRDNVFNYPESNDLLGIDFEEG
ncbi:MAG: hypothetical protein M1819_005134 [Sarea resinae]|nr:MAG: hypothetical protein M1819_005134 [Sarea resinae]